MNKHGASDINRFKDFGPDVLIQRVEEDLDQHHDRQLEGRRDAENPSKRDEHRTSRKVGVDQAGKFESGFLQNF